MGVLAVVGRPRGAERRRLLVALLVATLAAIGLGVAWAPGARAAEVCQADASTGCLVGTIRADEAPVDGVKLTITGTGVKETVTTGKDGRWSLAVPAGTYQVALDVDTLPAGEKLRDPAGNPREAQVELGKSRPVLFPLGGGGGTTATPTPGATASPTPGDTPTTGTSAKTGITTTRVAQQLVSGIIFGLLLALASVGLSLIYGTTGLSNFAHGEQVTLGGIVAYVAVQLQGVPLVLAGVIAVVIGAATGWLQDAGLWRPLRRRGVGPVQQMIVTIGLSMALQYGFQFFLGGSRLRISRGTPSTVNLGGVIITHQSIVAVVLSVVALGGTAYFLLRTRTGRATRAVADNPALAAASGITVERIIRMVWTLGAGLAALGGVLLGLYFNAIAWNTGGTILMLMFAAVTLGGLGTAFGALAGSMIIGLVAEMSSLVIPSDTKYAGALLILILVLLVRPQGILGRAERIG